MIKVFKSCFFVFIFTLSLAGSAEADNRRNIILIQTDDHSLKTINANYIDNSLNSKPVMPITQKEILERGVQFNNYYAATPLCAPNRTSLLSGRYSHNTGVITNSGANGGWLGHYNSNALTNNFVVRLNQAGYRTAHFGKFTNQYGSQGPKKFVPPGFDSWLSDYYDQSTRDFYGYYQLANINRLGFKNKIIGPIGYLNKKDPLNCRPTMKLVSQCFYHTDRMTSYAIDEIFDASSKREPFYIQLNYHSTHGDSIPPVGPEPASRHINSAKNTPLPKGNSNPNFNENTDQGPLKPFLIREKNGPLKDQNEAYIKSYWQTALESLRSVDEGIGALVDALKENGEYNNTYFIFTSDNGFFYGDHRFTESKFLAYHESARLPLLIAGPSSKSGVSNLPASTVDLAPTILDLTTGRSNYATDGRSIKNELYNPTVYPVDSKVYNQRVQIIEFLSAKDLKNGQQNFQLITPISLNPNRPASKAPALRYRGIKIGRYKYISYNNTSAELYDLQSDPEEMDNQINNPSYKEVVDYMKAALLRYRNCNGQQCLVEPPTLPVR
jgi:N-acetylglucosamine-6-sulfatase